MIKLTAEGKFIDTKEIKYLLTQGEKNADMIQVVIGAGNNDVDISGCSFTMRTVASEGSMTETVLSKLVVEGNINLIWIVPDTATAIAGMLRLELIGVKNDELIIKFKMPPIYVKEAVMGSNVPLPDVMDENLDQMHKILEEMRDIAGELPEGINMIDEIKNARKGVFSAYTYNTLGQRLAAEFNSCVQKDYFENRISTEIKLANNTGVGRFWKNENGEICGEIFGDYERNEASAIYSTAIGYRALAKSPYSKAIGYQVVASGLMSIAMGCDSMASKQSSFAAGCGAQATAKYAMALGTTVTAASESSIVLGRSNIPDENNKYVMIVGNGASFGDHSNGLTLDWDGNLWTAGDITATDSDGNNVSLCETVRAVSNLQNANAPTATKLQTARQINDVEFDGSKDITIPIKGCYAYDESTNAATAPWHKVASCTLTKGSEDAYAVFHVYRTLASTFPGGILKVRIRTNPDVTLQSCNLLWEYANNINKEDFILCIIQDQNSKTLTAELWVNISVRWSGYQFTMIADTDRTSIRNNKWTLYNSSTGQAAYTESYKTINSEFSPIQNTAELSGSDWIQLMINGGNGELYYRRYGKMVEIKGSVSPLNSGQWSLYTLPAGYRPSTASVDVLVMGNSPRNLNISTQGNITLSDITAHELIKIHACFLIN